MPVRLLICQEGARSRVIARGQACLGIGVGQLWPVRHGEVGGRQVTVEGNGSPLRCNIAISERHELVWRGVRPFERQLPVGQPVLLAWGTADLIIPPTQHHELASRLPARHVVEIVDAGNYPRDTESAQVLLPLLAFLGSTAAFEYDDTVRSRGALDRRTPDSAEAGLLRASA